MEWKTKIMNKGMKWGGKLEEEIGSTNKIIDKVNEDLEGYPTWVYAGMLQQVEELGFCLGQGGGLAEEVKKLETLVTEQERLLADNLILI